MRTKCRNLISDVQIVLQQQSPPLLRSNDDNSGEVSNGVDTTKVRILRRYDRSVFVRNRSYCIHPIRTTFDRYRIPPIPMQHSYNHIDQTLIWNETVSSKTKAKATVLYYDDSEPINSNNAAKRNLLKVPNLADTSSTITTVTKSWTKSKDWRRIPYGPHLC